jgi:alpha-glucosidase
MPICRPLFLNDPADKALLNEKQKHCSDQFFVGKDLLVAPVLEPDSAQGGVRPVYLPAGQSRWYCFMDNQLPLAESVAGGSTVSFDARLGFDLQQDPVHLRFLCPLYVRQGGVLPTIPQEQYVGELNDGGKPCPITFNIYPGRQGEYRTYLDDGKSRASAPADAPQFKNSYETQLGIAKSEYRLTQLQHKVTAEGTARTITLERLHDKYSPPKEDHFYVALLHDPAEKSTGTSSSPLLSVAVGGIDAAVVRDRRALEEASGDAWWFDAAAKVTYVKVQDIARLIKIQAKYVSRIPWA